MALTSDQLLAKFREDMVDNGEETLWSDDEIYLYIDAAQKEFCRRTYGISDSTTDEICRLEVGEDTEYISIDPRILAIRGARLTDGTRVELLSYQNIEGQSTFPPDYGIVRGLTLDDRTGPVVKALVTDMEQD